MVTADELRDRLRAVPAPSLVGVGDDVLDCYLHEDLAYPGGNALNVAAYSRLFFGGESAFLGILGDDRFADHLADVLTTLGVDLEQVRRVHGSNGMAFVALDDDGDRHFVGSNWGGVQRGLRLRLHERDLDYVSGFTRLHTSVYSCVEAELAAIAERGVGISFDFGDRVPGGLVEQVATHVEVGFFSGGGLPEAEVQDLGRYAVACGIEHAVVTLGARGSWGFTREGCMYAGIIDTDAVDALGAGDAFVTGYLAALAAGNDMAACLGTAAASGALACTYRGAFGYPVEAGEDARAQLLRRFDAP